MSTRIAVGTGVGIKKICSHIMGILNFGSGTTLKLPIDFGKMEA